VDGLVLPFDNLIISVLLMPFMHNPGIFFLVLVVQVLFIYLFVYLFMVYLIILSVSQNI
jgi:hypothetical protein